MKQQEVFSPLQNAIRHYEVDCKSKFRPTKDFYQSVGINRIRFWQLVKGKKELLVSEARNLSDFFNVPLEQLCSK